MNELPRALFQRWWHSFEEDHEAVTVYRPDDYDFPLARGRGGLEFQAGGTFIDYPVGPVDAPQSTLGRWRLAESGRLTVSFSGSGEPDRELEIVRCDEHILEIRSTPE
ncbi:hypothetical protein [Streptomyces tubercidicus]|uniref:Uncharacterized protein n=1 Tax=Streptomyces tubercidicus TaxID=47759 RepID=A0A640ULU5_9ACTN|nr:hypothetical protein [Streptomyces tubercidicus]WAU11106.1 hypothetical protein STRTU_001279 [Streptomyces tubercidicus]GFE36324.1 hypothetical protein Stube_09970 [Streptomyces tubercidicus]